MTQDISYDPSGERCFCSANMMFALVLLCLVIGPTLGRHHDHNLKVRHDFSKDIFDERAFIELPRYEIDAVNKGWLEKNRPPGPSGLESLNLFCPADDYTVCVLFDHTGYAAGLQIALEPNAFTNIYDWKKQGFTTWTTEFNKTKKLYFTIQQYYVSEESIKQNPISRIATRNSSILLQDGAIWLSAFNGDLLEISTKASDVTGPGSIFTKQKCLPGMGTHYYYKMSAETECTADTILPWFLLINNDQLIGVGFNVFAQRVPGKGPFNLFKHSGDTAVPYTVSNGPQCFSDLFTRNRPITMHTYFINAPYQVNCLSQTPVLRD